MKKVLCISLGWEQEPQLRILSKRADVKLYGIHYNAPILSGISFEEVITGDLRDLTRMLSFAERVRPDAVICDEDDYGAMLQAVIAERLGLPGPRIAQAQLGANKFLQRTRASEAGLKMPLFRLCASHNDAEEFARKCGYPLMIKPADNRGSIGAAKVNDAAELRDAFFKAMCASPSWLVIAEVYIEGEHFNVDGYCEAGNPRPLGVSRNIKSDREIVNDSLVYGDVKGELRDRLLREGERTALALGYNFGFFHGEFILSSSDKEIYLTEMANRGGGILISQLVLSQVTQLDLVTRYIADCLGESFAPLAAPSDHYVRIDFTSLEPGRTFAGLRDQSLPAEVVKVVPFLSQGSLVPVVENGAQRHIMVISLEREAERIARIKESVQNAVIYG